jgi:hypothetical protein
MTSEKGNVLSSMSRESSGIFSQSSVKTNNAEGTEENIQVVDFFSAKNTLRLIFLM